MTEQGQQIKETLSYFGEAFKEKFGRTYFCQFKKDTELVKKLLALYSVEELKNSIDLFFETHDAYIRKLGYSVGVFFTQINNLATENIGFSTPEEEFYFEDQDRNKLMFKWYCDWYVVREATQSFVLLPLEWFREKFWDPRETTWLFSNFEWAQKWEKEVKGLSKRVWKDLEKRFGELSSSEKKEIEKMISKAKEEEEKVRQHNLEIEKVLREGLSIEKP